jgi:hypothetical protein
MPVMRKTTAEEADAIHEIWFTQNSLGEDMQELADAIDAHIAKLQAEEAAERSADY